MDISEINARVQEQQPHVQTLFQELSHVIVGQKYFLERLTMGLLLGGHILVEGVPGLAKTLAVHTLADAVEASFQRIQFTPDLLPGDILGTLIYNQKNSSFEVKKGPIFNQIVLADEINRSPAKVQSALLEAMQEKQVTIGEETFPLDEVFIVIATQNPVEQEGTYVLPEAQVDRFLMKVVLGYPTVDEERQILQRMAGNKAPKAQVKITPKQILEMRGIIDDIYMDEKIRNYIVDIVYASRKPEDYGLKELKPIITYGASPRATISLTRTAKAHAFIRGRGYVIPEDIKIVGKDVLRHRIIPSYEAEAQDIDSEQIIKRIFDEVEVP